VDPNGEGIPSKTETYTYKADGNVNTEIDRNGITTSYVYDIHGRVIQQTTGSIVISYTYDNVGNRLTVTDRTGVTTRVYDDFGRVISKTVPNIGTSTYVYDINNGLESGFKADTVTDPKGNITTKVYDKANRLKYVKNGDIISSVYTTYNYNDNGTRNNVTYPGGASEVYTYYDNNLLKTLINKKSDGTNTDVYVYTYDAANNQISKHEIINGVEKGTTNYTYDSLNRLETVLEPNARLTTYTFDKSGNRKTETITSGSDVTVTTYNYDSQNKLTGTVTKINNIITETVSYGYDNNGNQLTVNKTPYINGTAQNEELVSTNSYDELNQLISTISGGKTTLNQYSDGLRILKSYDGQTTRYLYENLNVVLELNGSGDQKARNIYGTNLLTRTVDNETLYYMYNGHADVTALIDELGQVVGTYYYDAFGVIIEKTGTVDNNINYSGYQYDEETGLYYLNARMYDPRIARFLQEDTFKGNKSDPLSLNLYVYCHNEPLMYNDPTGHDSYVLYTTNKGSVFSNQATWQYNQLAKTEGKSKVHKKKINTITDFKKAWNEMGTEKGKTVNINVVVIYSHGNERALILTDGTSTNALSIDGKNSHGGPIGNLNILKSKKINKLYLYSCDAGNLAAAKSKKGNIAQWFLNHNKIGTVYAYDGSVSFGPPYVADVIDDYPARLADNQESFYTINADYGVKDTNIDPAGLILYRYNWDTPSKNTGSYA
jgi:RHS repeat-associated protein